MKRLRSDAHGIEGLPLRLMVSLAVLMITIPPALASFEAVQHQAALGRTEEEAKGFLLAARQLVVGGEGGKRSIHLDLRIEGMERFTIGGPPRSGYRSSSLSYKMLWMGEVHMSSHDPSFFLVSEDGGSMVLHRGLHALTLTVVDDMDFTGDREPDRAVMVEWTNS
ncbi:MAG: hypothetical protein KAT70_06770 [Thermoplasmata archaeon]|nr:hypothetical protein [Thermoplasmata archaeon]